LTLCAPQVMLMNTRLRQSAHSRTGRASIANSGASTAQRLDRYMESGAQKESLNSRNASVLSVGSLDDDGMNCSRIEFTYRSKCVNIYTPVPNSAATVVAKHTRILIDYAHEHRLAHLMSFCHAGCSMTGQIARSERASRIFQARWMKWAPLHSGDFKGKKLKSLDST
jgi:hypothetical protein